MTVQFGTRFFIILLARALSEYGRHQVKINEDMPAPVRAALITLIDAMPDLLLLNEPGPE